MYLYTIYSMDSHEMDRQKLRDASQKESSKLHKFFKTDF